MAHRESPQLPELRREADKWEGSLAQRRVQQDFREDIAISNAHRHGIVQSIAFHAGSILSPATILPASHPPKSNSYLPVIGIGNDPGSVPNEAQIPAFSSSEEFRCFGLQAGWSGIFIGREPTHDGVTLPESYRLHFMKHIGAESNQQTRFGFQWKTDLFPLSPVQQPVKGQ